MTTELDSLLKDIEGEGGFRDASIKAQTQCFIGLENDICALSQKCRTWRVLIIFLIQKPPKFCTYFAFFTFFDSSKQIDSHGQLCYCFIGKSCPVLPMDYQKNGFGHLLYL